MEKALSPERLTPTYQTTRCQNPENKTYMKEPKYGHVNADHAAWQCPCSKIV